MKRPQQFRWDSIVVSMYIDTLIYNKYFTQERSLPVTKQHLDQRKHDVEGQEISDSEHRVINQQVGGELTVHDFWDSLGGDINRQVRLFWRFIPHTDPRQSI